MRVMVMVKASKDSEAGVMPSPKLFAEMGKFNQELIQAGMLLAGGWVASELEGQAGEVFRAAAHGD